MLAPNPAEAAWEKAKAQMGSAMGAGPSIAGPDPSVLTTQQMLLGVANLEKLTEALQSGDIRVVDEKIASIRREIAIFETHRLELKGDNQRTVETAMIAAEKAVQAALAAAEKARDQQTIASQLATTKAEEASKEQMKQQGETFSTAIAGLNSGFSDVKTMLGELRAEKRAGQERAIEIHDAARDSKPILDAIAELRHGQAEAFGRSQQIVEHRSKNTNTGLWVGIGVSVFAVVSSGFVNIAVFVISYIITHNKG